MKRKEIFYGSIKSTEYFKNISSEHHITAGTAECIIRDPKRRNCRNTWAERFWKIDAFEYSGRSGRSDGRKGFYRRCRSFRHARGTKDNDPAGKNRVYFSSIRAAACSENYRQYPSAAAEAGCCVCKRAVK